jgi:ribulose-5-phosphate 4-epimerase/fuculose-1-phosphate aldolase
MTEKELRDKIAIHAKSIFDRRYTCGGSGNISVRLEDGILVTPTNSCLGRLNPDRISKIDWNGNLLAGDRPSKEWILHLAVYRARPEDRAVVHLHSPHAVAVSCLEGLDPDDVLPPLTPYFVMRIGRLPLVSYYPPGAEELAAAVGEIADKHKAVLLARHGTVVAGKNLEDAVYTAEELEETATLFLLLQNKNFSVLNAEEILEIEKRFNR